MNLRFLKNQVRVQVTSHLSDAIYILLSLRTTVIMEIILQLLHPRLSRSILA